MRQLLNQVLSARGAETRNSVTVMALAMTLFTTTLAQAVTLPPNNGVALPGTTVIVRPELAGTIVADVITPWDDLNGDSGTFQSRVVREASGTLDFYYQVANDTTSALPVFGINVGDFGTFSIDVDFRTDRNGTRGFDQAASATFPGHNAISFFVQDNAPIAPGEESLLMFIRTDARAFTIDDSTFATEIDLIGGPFGFLSAFAPSFVPTAVPLPGTLWLIGIGAIGLYSRQPAKRRKLSSEHERWPIHDPHLRRERVVDPFTFSWLK